VLDLHTFKNLGIIKNELSFDNHKLEYFTHAIRKMKEAKDWEKEEIVVLFKEMLPNFNYEDKGKYLDSKM